MAKEDLQNPEAASQNEPQQETEVVEEVVEPEIVEESAEDIQEQVDDLERLQQEIDKLNQQLAESETERKRAYADMANTRKRLQKEADLTKQYRFQSAATALLPVLDNLEAALAHVPENEEAQNFAKGFSLIQNQLAKVLQDEGVVEIEALNQPFDANFMQALMMEPKEGVESGIVIDVLQKGYKIKERLLRPALVKVSE